MKSSLRNLTLAAAVGTGLAGQAVADNVINDDLIVTFSACIGNDCVNGETFGFDTLRLKENNVRIAAVDTSNSGSFPTNDWELTFNDSTNGGDNYFAVLDRDTNRRVFRVDAGARANAMVLSSSSRLGMGTNNPAVTMHAKEGNTPTLRLEQDGSSGFASQTFDIASNETNFFVRDVTNGSQLPFRIKPGAPTNSLFVAADGDIGMGTTSPDSDLNVIGDLLVTDSDDGTAGMTGVHVRNVAEPGNQTLMMLDNTQGRPRIQLRGSGNSAQTGDWSISGGSTLVFQDRVSGTNVLIVDQTGNVTISGTLTEGSDKHSKTGISEVDPAEILKKLRGLPVNYWTYKQDADRGIRHIGPMAQDFYATFGTGASGTGISTLDTSGVAFAAIQALAEENSQLKDRLAVLETKLD